MRPMALFAGYFARILEIPMSNSFLSETGLGLLGIPLGMLLIFVTVAALFFSVHDTPSPKHLPTAQYQASDVH
jgi:hypothetical protein